MVFKSHGLGSRADGLTGVVAFAAALAFVMLICMLFQPVWATNDDVAMSMVAHGYGGAAFGTPTIIFSNVIWGAIVRALPSIDGILGYSIGTLGALVLSGSAIIYFLRRLGNSWPICCLAFLLVLMRPVMFPQFTVNAGLLTAAGVIGLLDADRRDAASSLIAACILIFLGYIVRGLEMMLVLLVALPILPWRRLKDRASQIAMAGLAVGIASAALTDYWAYSGDEWTYFKSLNLARAAFTDFGAVDRVLERPDVMARYGLSANDVRLIGNWFFVDKALANPDVLKAVLQDISFVSASNISLAAGLAAIGLVDQKALMTIVVTACILVVGSLRPKLILCLLLCFGAMFAIGALGRQSVVRVYLPLFTLVLLLPLVDLPSRQLWRKSAALVTLFIAVIANSFIMSDEIKASDKKTVEVRSKRFKSVDSTVIWGESLPFEQMYPVLTRSGDIPDTRIYGLGVFTFAPFSVPVADEAAGKGMIARLLSQEGVPIIIYQGYLDKLKIYCDERHGKVIAMADEPGDATFPIRRARCQAKVDGST